MSAKILKKCKV